MPATESPARDIRYERDERPPHILSLGLGFQYVMLSIGGIVLTPAIVIRAAGGSEGYLAWAVFAGLCVCGISTFIQAVGLGRIGARYILLMGTSGAFIAASVTALESGGPNLLATLVVASSLFQFFLSSRLSLLRHVITPAVAGIVIMLIAVTIFPIAFNMLENLPAGAPPAAAPASAVTTLVCTAALALLGKGALRLWAPLLGIVAGCVAASFFGVFDMERVASAAWIGVPASGWPGLAADFGPSFWSLLPVFVLVTIVGAIETIGDSIAIQHVSWRQTRATDFRAVQGAVAADGLGNLLSGLSSTVPNTTYSSSVAIAQLTGVASRSIGVFIGILFVLAAFLPKVAAVLLAIPEPVVAGFVMVLLAMLFSLGMKMVVSDGLDYRTSIVVGLSFWLGVGFQNQQVYARWLGETLASILGNGMTAGGLIAIVLTLAMNLAAPRRKTITAKLEIDSLPEVLKFVHDVAKSKGWARSARQRLRAATEEAILSVAPLGDDAEREGSRKLRLSIRGTRRSFELELIASSVEGNLEDRLAFLSNPAGSEVDSEYSLRLLRHYASSVRHRKYHDADLITVQVEGGTV